METKTQRAISLFQNGDYKAAFRIFKGFKIGFSNEEHRNIAIAYECIGDQRSVAFYQSLGVDTLQVEKDAVLTIKRKYNL